MKKAFLAMALLLMPFFSSADIWRDGTVDLKLAKSQTITNFNCGALYYTTTQHVYEGQDPELNSLLAICYPKVLESELARNSNYTACGDYTVELNTNIQGTHNSFTITYTPKDYLNRCMSTTNDSTISMSAVVTGEDQASTCPPDAFPTYLSLIEIDEIDYCYDVNQANLVDSCNATSGQSTLNLQVTSSSGCFPQSDGSVCKYQAVDVGGGEQVYQMDLEASCYGDESANDLSNNQDKGGLPVDDNCVNNGGLMVCPEDPDNVCNASGSAYGGGSINNCQSGCGYVNDSFVCYDTDTDSDGLPDYNDPDIDGDGVANEQDLDADGDGQDDPIYNNDSSGSGSGSGSGSSVDMSGVISELQKANQSLDNIEAGFDTSHGLTPDSLDKDNRLTNQNDEYQDKLDAFHLKTAGELGYVDSLDLTNTGFSNLMLSDTCQVYSLPVGGRSFDLDLCAVSSKVKGFLAFFFGFGAAFYMFYRINSTLRGDS